MPVLTNAKHERFAQALADGKTALAAYVEAGYRPNDGNASTLKADQRISKRVAEILSQRETIRAMGVAKAIERAAYEVADAMSEAEEARSLAMNKGNAGAAVAAILLKAKLAGLVIDRKESGDPGDFKKLSADELRSRISREAAELGVDVGGIAPPRGSDPPLGKPH